MLISKLLLGPLKAHANESSAIYKLGLISQAEAKYRSAYPATGYACSLSSLGGLDESGSPSAEKAQLLPSNLAGGEGAGYTFEIVSCTKGTQNIADPYISYEITAVPREIGSTGERGFCADVQGTITVDPSGGTNCTQPLK
jgi:type IV pilus assembly protein PilA